MTQFNYNSPQGLQQLTDELDAKRKIEEAARAAVVANRTREQHIRDNEEADKVGDWDYVRTSWENNKHHVLQDYVDNSWGKENTQRWLKTTATKHSPEEGDAVIETDWMGNPEIKGNLRQTDKLEDIQTSLRAFRNNNPDLNLPQLGFDQLPSENAAIIAKDNKMVRYSQLKKLKYTDKTKEDMKTLGFEDSPLYYYDDMISEELLANLKETNNPNYQVMKEFREELDALLFLDASKTAAITASNKRISDLRNREDTNEELRIMALADAFNVRLGKGTFPETHEINSSNIGAINNKIEHIVYQARDGGWDHDTNIAIMNLYSKSYKRFAETAKSNTQNNNYWQAAAVDTDVRAGVTRPPVGSSLKMMLINGMGKVVTDFRRNGWEGTDPAIRQHLMEIVAGFNKEAQVAYTNKTGLTDIVTLFKPEDIMNGDFGIRWNELSHKEMYAGMMFMTSQMIDGGANYSEMSQAWKAAGNYMIGAIQDVPIGDFRNKQITLDWLLESPENIDKFTRANVALQALGEMVFESSTKDSRLGQQIIAKIFEGTGIDARQIILLRGLGMEIHGNLINSGLGHGQLIEMFELIGQGKADDAIEVEIKNPKTGEITTEMMSPSIMYDLIWEPITDDSDTLLSTAIQREVKAGNMGRDPELTDRTKHNLSRLMSSFGRFSKIDGGFTINEDTIRAAEAMGIEAPWDDGSDVFWDKDWKLVQNSRMISTTLEDDLRGSGDTAGVSRNKMIAMLNAYASSPATRDTMQAILVALKLENRSVTPSRLLNLVDKRVGLMGGMLISLEDLEHTERPENLAYIPHIARLSELPHVNNQTGDENRTNAWASAVPFSWAVDPALRSLDIARESFYTPDSTGRSIVPQESVRAVNNTTYRHVADALSAPVMKSLGYGDTPEGRAAFHQDIQQPMWEQEAIAWTNSQQVTEDNEWYLAPYRGRTNLDWSLGALERVFVVKVTKDNNTLSRIFNSYIPLFKSSGENGYADKDEFGRFYYHATTQLVTSSTPLGIEGYNQDSIPEHNLLKIIVHKEGKTFEVPLSLSFTDKNIDTYVREGDLKKEDIGKYAENNWSIFREILEPLGLNAFSPNAGGLVQTVAQWMFKMSDVHELYIRDKLGLIDPTEKKILKDRIKSMDEDWQRIEDAEARKALLSIQKYYYHNGKYPPGIDRLFPASQAANTGEWSVGDDWRAALGDSGEPSLPDSKDKGFGEWLVGTESVYKFPDGTSFTMSQIQEELEEMSDEDFMELHGGKGKIVPESVEGGVIGDAAEGLLKLLGEGDEDEEIFNNQSERIKAEERARGGE